MTAPRWAGLGHADIAAMVAAGPGPSASAGAERAWRDAAAALADVHRELSGQVRGLPGGMVRHGRGRRHRGARDPRRMGRLRHRRRRAHRRRTRHPGRARRGPAGPDAGRRGPDTAGDRTRGPGPARRLGGRRPRRGQLGRSGRGAHDPLRRRHPRHRRTVDRLGRGPGRDPRRHRGRLPRRPGPAPRRAPARHRRRRRRRGSGPGGRRGVGDDGVRGDRLRRAHGGGADRERTGRGARCATDRRRRALRRAGPRGRHRDRRPPHPRHGPRTRDR